MGWNGSVASTQSFTAVRDWLATTANLVKRTKARAALRQRDRRGPIFPTSRSTRCPRARAEMPERGITAVPLPMTPPVSTEPSTAHRFTRGPRCSSIEFARRSRPPCWSPARQKSHLRARRGEPRGGHAFLPPSASPRRRRCARVPSTSRSSKVEQRRAAAHRLRRQRGADREECAAEAEHALCSEGKIAEMVIRASEELETMLTRGFTGPQRLTQPEDPWLSHSAHCFVNVDRPADRAELGPEDDGKGHDLRHERRAGPGRARGAR